MGISHVDPIKYDIKFARFLNEFRDTLPDIDFDFPYNMQDDVFLELEMKWPGKLLELVIMYITMKNQHLEKRLEEMELKIYIKV